MKTALISYPFKTFTEILGNIFEGFGLKTAKEREAMEFLLGNSEDATPTENFFMDDALSATLRL